MVLRILESIGEVSRYILANAVGILAGTCGVLILQSVVSTSGGFSAVVIFSSAISFFVLGRISSMVHSSTKLCKPQMLIHELIRGSPGFPFRGVCLASLV
jgi:hypothetical protein